MNTSPWDWSNLPIPLVGLRSSLPGKKMIHSSFVLISMASTKSPRKTDTYFPRSPISWTVHKKQDCSPTLKSDMPTTLSESVKVTNGKLHSGPAMVPLNGVLCLFDLLILWPPSNDSWMSFLQPPWYLCPRLLGWHSYLLRQSWSPLWPCPWSTSTPLKTSFIHMCRQMLFSQTNSQIPWIYSVSNWTYNGY